MTIAQVCVVMGGFSLFLALLYGVVGAVLLVSGTDVYCTGFFFSKIDNEYCNFPYGRCQAGVCICEYGFAGDQCRSCRGIVDPVCPASPKFKGTQLVTSEWGDAITEWVGPLNAQSDSTSWILCYSSFEDASPLSFHEGCDDSPTTITIINNSLGFVFGGYVSMLSPAQDNLKHTI